MNKNDDGFLKVSKFVNTAINLSEGIERDIKKDSRISKDTVLRLNEFRKATIRAAKLLEQFNEATITYKN